MLYGFRPVEARAVGGAKASVDVCAWFTNPKFIPERQLQYTDF